MAIQRHHLHDGSNGVQLASAGAENYDASSGTLPTYTNTGAQSNTGLRWTSAAAAAYLQDNLAFSYVAFYLYLPTLPTTDMCIVAALDSASTGIGSVVIPNTGLVRLHNGLGASVDTLASAISATTIYRLEMFSDSTGSELRVYPGTSTSALDILTGASSGNVTNKWRFGLPQAGRSGTTGDQFVLDEVYVADDWPNLGIAPSMTFIKTVTVG